MEYLTTLQEWAKWLSSNPNLKLNDMVVIVDNQSLPLVWRMGRVVELLLGSDGVVHVVKIRTRHGPLTRPVAKLILLPTQ